MFITKQKLFLVVFFIFYLINHLTSQVDLNSNSNNKCFEYCKKKPPSEITYDPTPVFYYTGADFENPYVVKAKVEKSSTSTWIPTNTGSYKFEQKSEYNYVYVVLDTNKVKEYTFNNQKANLLIKRKIYQKPATSQWEKKNRNENCISRNPEDCVIWSWVNTPITYSQVYINPKIPNDSLDIDVKDDFMIQTSGIFLNSKTYNSRIQKVEVIQTEITEVICANKITTELIHQVEQFLMDEGYELKFSNTDKLNLQTKSTLEDYQHDNNLPIGHLNIPTLENMGININKYTQK
jgi:hypothetical protein